jgi:hypothetical protein
VALLAKRLPVIQIPKQSLITSMWLDMVDHASQAKETSSAALAA